MKEQVQKTGVRKWAGQDLVDLQREPLAAVTAFFEEYGSCVIKGCDVVPTGNTYTVTPGMVALEGTDQNGQPTFKVAPFAGVEGVTLPVYLTLTYSIVERPYADLKVKPIAYDFRAAVTGVKPTDMPYLEIGVAGGKSFVDAIQDAKHRFLTDTERNKLTGIEAGANNYVHPVKHPASMIEQDDQNRMVTTAKMGEWDAKATTAYVAQQIAALVASSPAALDTLNELAAALGGDANFATTVMNALAGKAGINHSHAVGDIADISNANVHESRYARLLLTNGEEDLNKFLESGVFRTESGTNGVKSYAPLLNVRGFDTVWQLQAAHGTNSFSIQFRSGINDSFGPWRELFHTGNFNPADYATTSSVAQQIAALVASSPATLDTLNELAAALGGDANFATTVMNALAGKAPLNHVHDSISSLDSIPALAGTNRNLKGMRLRGVVANGYPGTYGNVIQFQGPLFGGELFIDSRGGDGKTGNGEMWLRVISDWATSEWSDWVKVFHTGNFDPTTKAEANHNHDDKYQPKGSYLTQSQLENCFPSGAFSADGSKKEHFLDVICAGSVKQTCELKDYWGANNINGYPFNVMKVSNGVYRIIHESSLAYYGVVVTCRDVDSSDEKDNYATVLNRNTASFDVNTFNSSGSRQDSAFDFIMYRLR